MFNKNYLLFLVCLLFSISCVKAQNNAGYENLAWGSTPNELINEYTNAVIIYSNNQERLSRGSFVSQYELFTNNRFSIYQNHNIVIYSEFQMQGSNDMADGSCRYFFYYNNQLFKVWHLLPHVGNNSLNQVLETLNKNFGSFDKTNALDFQLNKYNWKKDNLNIEYLFDGYSGSVIYLNPNIGLF